MAALARILAILLAALSLHAALSTGGRVPAGVSSIRIRSAAGLTATVTRPAAVGQIVRWFDALPRFRVQRCPLERHFPPTVTFAFRDSGGSVLLRAVDRDPGICGSSVAYTTGGHVARVTLADDDFVARVSRLLGVDFGARPTTAGNRRAARHAVGKLLRLAVLPPGARRLARVPGNAGGELSKPLLEPSYTNYVGRHAFWHVDGSVGSVTAFIEAHRPRGSQPAGGESSPPPVSLVFDLPSTRRLYQRQLEITIASLPNGSAGIRVDAFAVWNVERTREVVPPGVRKIDFSSGFGSYRTKSARQVATIVRWFNALPVAQPRRGIFNCPAIFGPYIRIAFEGAGGAVLARASVDYDRGYSYWCNAIQFSIGGHREKPLIGGHFMRRVGHLLHVRFG